MLEICLGSNAPGHRWQQSDDAGLDPCQARQQWSNLERLDLPVSYRPVLLAPLLDPPEPIGQSARSPLLPSHRLSDIEPRLPARLRQNFGIGHLRRNPECPCLRRSNNRNRDATKRRFPATSRLREMRARNDAARKIAADRNSHSPERLQMPAVPAHRHNARLTQLVVRLSLGRSLPVRTWEIYGLGGWRALRANGGKTPAWGFGGGCVRPGFRGQAISGRHRLSISRLRLQLASRTPLTAPESRRAISRPPARSQPCPKGQLKGRCHDIENRWRLKWDVAMRQRRTLKRIEINQLALVHVDGVRGVHPCLVMNLHAMLHSSTHRTAAFKFALSLDGFNTTRHCRVVWRDGNTCGVEFIDQGGVLRQSG